MSLVVDLLPIPRFDVSLIRYLNTNFIRIRDILAGAPKMCAGKISVNFAAQNALSVVATFSKTFTVTPVVVATALDGFAASAVCECTAISTTTATIRIYSANGTNYTGGMEVQWIASEQI